MKWKLINPTGAETKARHGHRAVACDEGFIVYGGGNCGICPELHVYSISQNKNTQPTVSGKICPGVAAFGMAMLNDRIIIFGGMFEYRLFSNEIFTLNPHNWVWGKATSITGDKPAPRIGHSFTAISEDQVVMFGGITNIHKDPVRHLTPAYQNDLFILRVLGKSKFSWTQVTQAKEANWPSERESHSAIFHDNKNFQKRFLIIFGGMNDVRLNDLWFLDLDQLIWMQFEVNGIPPEPRSLHTASLVGTKMFIFGGWVLNDENSIENKYKASNSLHYIDLDEFEWHLVTFDEMQAIPIARAGHSAVATHDRMYIFGGRPFYNYTIGTPGEHLNDVWFLELAAPKKIERISLVCAQPKTIEIKWDRVPNANGYLLEIREVPEVNLKMNAIKLVSNMSQSAEGHTPRKVVVINPNKRKIEQVDGCNDEVEAMDTSTASTEGTKKTIIMKSKMSWGTVGIFKNNTVNVDGYFTFEFPSNFNEEMCPDNVVLPKIDLKSNTMYAFRVAGINSCGTGEFSKIYAFRTVAQGWPSKPLNCKFIMMPDALRLAWPLSPAEENIKEYTLSIARKYGNTLTYALLYKGVQPTCTIALSLLEKPEYRLTTDTNPPKTFFSFRIAATNNHGSGPFLQVQYTV